jgi:hypothetical protein
VSRRSFASAALAGALPFVVYALSSSQQPGFWDLGEMAAVPYLFGIAHPTGFPLFVMLGWIFTHLIPIGSIAWKTTLLAAAGAAAAAFALWFALDALGVGGLFATGSAWWFAFGDVVWQRATRTDVHALELGFEALALAFAIRFYRKGSARVAIAAAFCTGCALATHPNALWVVPGVAILLCARRSMPYAYAALALVLPVLAYLYIPLRSNYLATNSVDPTLALGLPPGQPFWNYGDPHTLGGFWWLITGAQYPTHGVFAAMLNPLQYVRGVQLFVSFATQDHAGFALVLVVAGFVVLVVRSPVVAAGLAASFLAWCGFVYSYQTMENDPPRYMLAALWIATLCAANLWFPLGRTRALRHVLTVIALVAGLACLWSDRGRFLEAHDTQAGPYIARVIRETRPHDVIVAQWNYVTPLGYAKYATRTLSDRVPVNADPFANCAMIAQLARRFPTDIVLEHPVAICGVRLRALDRGFPTIYRVTPVR